MKKVMITLAMFGFLGLGSLQFLTASATTNTTCFSQCHAQFQNCLNWNNSDYCREERSACMDACLGN